MYFPFLNYRGHRDTGCPHGEKMHFSAMEVLPATASTAIGDDI